ncbi:hypothetical protein SKAU_G00293830 [Synaphobranchus kaupii]|uniref:Scaffolding anchor of CK1 domain-containing protein n=1 Tax=Synaphobranchus kaupii TaxID=118154 RepID=A0A9Q1IKF7_SYNKA|nr:hypothetical protein SKAU_G00293830 [Synaphobranchus kaupii]
MALSQVQCLDDNHVNWRMQESKPEFFYSEDQRLALEALIHGGRKAFLEYIQDHSVRQFLSELEQNQLTGAAVACQPDSEEEGAEDSEDVEGSLQYWPERSDDSIPELDIGWNDRVSYRGVTRVSVYMQPPMDGQTHIKEVVRKTIALAQKVIAVVMDLFTDVDIFKDLLDASFKRKVAVYVILEATGVPHFLSMCKRAAMHRGHLKKLRVRSAGGTELHTRSLTKVCGLLSQKFMFVDGDRAVSGSYSYTWTASRLDRNLVTVLTGQAVETFDRQFRQLYFLSDGVSLSEVSMEVEPEPVPTPPLVTPPPPSPALARRLINPKYALVSANINGNTNATGTQNATGGSSETSSARTAGCSKSEVKGLRRPGEAAEGAPVHPGLLGLEQADLIHYLPTWPEPDPPSDVIGFINIRDSGKPLQAHLTRSEQFETSQPIRFKDPLILPEEPLPEKACPKPQLQNLRTANGPSATDTQEVQKEAKEGSSVSVTSEEHPENGGPATPGSACNGPEQSEVQSQADELNKTGALQPMAKQPHPQQAARVLQTLSERKPERKQTHRQVQTDRRKVIQTSSRPPANNVRSQQDVQVRGMAKAAGTRLDGCIHPPNLAGASKGAHTFWQGKQLAQNRPGQGSDFLSRDQLSRTRSSSCRPAQAQLGNQTSHDPYRQPLGRARPTRQGPAAHRPPGPQGDGRGPPGLLFTRHSQFRAMNGTVPEAQLGSLQRMALLGRKGAN